MDLKIVDKKINFSIEMSKEEIETLRKASDILTDFAATMKDKGFDCVDIDGLTYSANWFEETAADLTELSIVNEGYFFE